MSTIKGQIGQLVCEHRVSCQYWHNVATDVWHAKIIHTELRQGRQYGGEVVDEITSEPGARYDDFKRAATDKARKGMALFWTNGGLREGRTK